MSNFHNFLVEHALFPFPEPKQTRFIASTDLFALKIARLNLNWKAKYAVKDNMLVHKHCKALQDILGDHELSAASKDYLFGSFSPPLGVELDSGMIQLDWEVNANEAQVSSPKDFITC